METRKILAAIILVLVVSANAFSQNIGVAINSDGAAPNNCAILDVSSTTKAFLPPRMTNAQKVAIATPAAGLMVWCSNCGPSGELQIFNGTTWTNTAGGAASGLDITDGSGNTYETVTIGTQTWLTKNLYTTKYNDGTDILTVTSSVSWSRLTSGAYCDYSNDPSNTATYGRLYNWHAVNTGKLCPTGWHVPTDAEWTTLAVYLGGSTGAGGKLKETGTAHWTTPNSGATDEKDFTALPGGFRPSRSVFSNIGIYGYWWSSTVSSTQYNSPYAYYLEINYNSDVARTLMDDGRDGMSVRCLKD